MLPLSLRLMLERRYDLGQIAVIGTLGDTWNQVLHLGSGRGSIVLRISHPSATAEGIAYEHRLLSFASRRIPEAPAPLPARDGSTFFSHEGRLVSLFPYVRGRPADRRKDGERADAARMLARLHAALLEYPSHRSRPGHPSLRDLDWDRNHMWDWPAVRDLLERGEVLLGRAPQTSATTRRATVAIAARLPLIEHELEQISRWIAELAASGRALRVAPVHGDYWSGNILVDEDRITAVVDWDDCRPEWLSWELGRALWEFCRKPEDCSLDPSQVEEFLAAYRSAGGPVSADEDDLLLPFICCVRLYEVLWALGEASRHGEWDPRYTLENLLYLERLRLHPFPYHTA